MRNIHNDNDIDILERIKYQLSWFDLYKKVEAGIANKSLAGTTVNERLYETGLLTIFDKYKAENKDFAEYILNKLGVDKESITEILK